MSRIKKVPHSRITLCGVLLSMSLGVAPSMAQQADGPGGEPPRRGRGRGPGGPGGGFGPGNFLAPQILKFADVNKDGRLTVAEAGTAAAKLVTQADKSKKGSVNALELSVLLNARIEPPRGPGGPGGPGDDDGPGGPPPDGFGGGRRPDGPPPGDEGGPGGPPPGGFNDGPGGHPPGGPGGPGPGGRSGIGSMIARDVIAAADSNKDGRLSPAEAQAAAERLVTEADRGKQGSVRLDGLVMAINSRLSPRGGPGGPPGGRGRMSSLAPRIMAFADANKDGKLSADEAAAAASRYVREVDSDKEGSIAFERLVKLFGSSEGFGPGGRNSSEYPPRGHGGGDMQAMQIMKLVDTDNDDHISPDEAAQVAKRMVSAAGTSGSVDLDGLREILNNQMGSPFGPGGPPPGGPGGFDRPGGPGDSQ